MDITYVRIRHDFAYLSVVMDLYNNEIVAWELSERNDLKLECGPALLHSDQRFQNKLGDLSPIEFREKVAV